MSEYETGKFMQVGDRKALYGLFILWLVPTIGCYTQLGDIWLCRIMLYVSVAYAAGAVVAFVDARHEARYRQGRRIVHTDNRGLVVRRLHQRM